MLGSYGRESQFSFPVVCSVGCQERANSCGTTTRRKTPSPLGLPHSNPKGKKIDPFSTRMDWSDSYVPSMKSSITECDA